MHRASVEDGSNAAKRFFRRLLKGLQYVPRVIVTDKLRSHGIARRHLLPGVEHRQSRYLDNRAENSHRPTPRRERTAKRDRKAALRFLYKATGQHGTPAKITIDKSGANTAAIESDNAAHDTEVEIRQVKYLNNVVEQDHRAIKRHRSAINRLVASSIKASSVHIPPRFSNQACSEPSICTSSPRHSRRRRG
jgi:transposase-like protein